MHGAIHLDPSDVPAFIRGAYTGKKFKVQVRESVTIPAGAGIWDGDSLDTYSAVTLVDGAVPLILPAPGKGYRVELRPDVAVVCRTIFCGKDLGLTIFLHPDAKLIPAPEMTATENLVVLTATASW